jgi:hypothetical protein
VEKQSVDRVLANEEIKAIVNALGCGFSQGYGNDFNLETSNTARSSSPPMPTWTVGISAPCF